MNLENYAIYDSPYGKLKICYSEDKITFLKKITEDDIKNRGNHMELTDNVYAQLQQYFSGKRQKFDFPYKLHGTQFQMKVWKALCDIPYGETRTYKDIAIAIGNPKASRAVGMANNKNPITIAVPCHRVIGANGKLVGYAGGIEMKKGLLDLERGNINERANK